jgi:hypothetical protein
MEKLLPSDFDLVDFDSDAFSILSYYLMYFSDYYFVSNINPRNKMNFSKGSIILYSKWKNSSCCHLVTPRISLAKELRSKRYAKIVN